jgi:hypothetical protein
MGHFRLRDSLGHLTSLQKRVLALSKDAFRKSTETYRSAKGTIVGISLILVALLFAVLAYQLTRQEALINWNQGHFAPASLWRAALAEKSLEEIHDVDQLQKAARLLPTRVDSAGSVWASPSGPWIAVILPDDPPLLFRPKDTPKESKGPPTDWIPLGRGWSSYEETLSWLKQNAPKHQNSKEKITPHEFHDPRELRY